MSYAGRKFCVSKPGRSCGFSLLELILVLCLVSILSAIATPSVSSWVESSRIKSLRNQLLTAFSDARYQALTQSSTVTLCKVKSGECAPDMGFPITIFIDSDRDAKLDSNEEVLHVLDAQIPETARLIWNRSSGYLRFWPNGGTGALTGSLSYCHTDMPNQNFRLVVARTGRLRIDERETRCP